MVSSTGITWELVRTAESADPVSDLLSILRSPADFHVHAHVLRSTAPWPTDPTSRVYLKAAIPKPLAQTAFVEDNFFTYWCGGWFRMIQAHYIYFVLYFLLLLHQLYSRSSGIRSQRLGNSALKNFYHGRMKQTNWYSHIMEYYTSQKPKDQQCGILTWVTLQALELSARTQISE